VRAMDKALAALALRASPTLPSQRERRLVPAVDDADAALLDRAAISHQRAALIASLWPWPAGQCMARPVFSELPAPAVFGALFQVSLPTPPEADARALQARLARAFAQPEPDPAAQAA